MDHVAGDIDVDSDEFEEEIERVREVMERKTHVTSTDYMLTTSPSAAAAASGLVISNEFNQKPFSAIGI